MEVHAKGEVRHAVVIDSDALSRLWARAEEFAGSPAATVSCADGIERRFLSLQELIDYENPQRFEARTIEIFAQSRDPSRSVSISIGGSWGARASVSLRGDEHDALHARSRVLDCFAGMRAWYSPVATFDLWMFWLFTLGALWLLATTMAPGTNSDRPGRSFVEAMRQIGSGLVVVVPAVMLVYGVGWFRARFFPMVAMAFGQGAKTFKFNEQVRWAVVVALVVSLAASTIYGAAGGAGGT